MKVNKVTVEQSSPPNLAAPPLQQSTIKATPENNQFLFTIPFGICCRIDKILKPSMRKILQFVTEPAHLHQLSSSGACNPWAIYHQSQPAPWGLTRGDICALAFWYNPLLILRHIFLWYVSYFFIWVWLNLLVNLFFFEFLPSVM